MINILLLEDNALKAQSISKALLSNPYISEDNITTVVDTIQAKSKLAKENYDLFVVDIQIPIRFNQLPDPEGGIKLLRDIVRSERLSRPAHIIGITAYHETFESAQKEFQNYLWNVLYYDISSSEWSDQLKNRINYLVNSSLTIRSNIYSEFQVDFCVICALEGIELSALKSIANDWEKVNVSNDTTNYYLCTFNSHERKVKLIVASAHEMGMSAAGILSTKLIYTFRPKYLFMSGIAAGVRGKANLGDILIADPSFDYGSGKFEKKGKKIIFSPDPRQIRVHSEILDKLKDFIQNKENIQSIKKEWDGKAPANNLEIHIGPIGSGSAVLADQSKVEGIMQFNRKLIGIEMETYAMYCAATNCSNPKPYFVSIKSVCDYADEFKNDNFQPYAAFTSAVFIKKFILEYLEAQSQ